MKTIIAGLILILFCNFNSVAFGSPKNKTISLSYHDAGWPPYVMIDNNGIMVDTISTITDKLGYKLLIKLLPEKRIELHLRMGRTDCRPKAREWVDKPDQYYWTDPVVISKDILIFRKGEFSEINSLKAIEQSEIKVIGAIFGYKYPTIETLFSSGKIKRQDIMSTSLLLKVLQLGRINAIITNKFVAQWIINNDPALSHDMFRLGPQIAEAGYRFLFSMNDDWSPFIVQFNKELARMKTDGRLQEILDKYLK